MSVQRLFRKSKRPKRNNGNSRDFQNLGARSNQPEEQSQEQPGQGKRKAALKIPPTMKKPSRRQAHLEKDIFEDPALDAIFGGISFREANMNTSFTPSTPEAIEISRLMYREMLCDDPMLHKLILPEYLDYYTTAMIWFRMISLKSKLWQHRQHITTTEETVLQLLANAEFVIPDPLLMQIKVLGSIQTKTGEHLYPVFPEIPVAVVANHGGYYGQITVDTHNLYEEIPCLGVLSEAVRQAVSNAAPGASYASALAEPDIIPNANLLGFRPLGTRRDEAKNVAFHCGITAVDFPECPANTGINMELLSQISGCLARTKTFEVTNINFRLMNTNGSVMQAMFQKNPAPVDPPTLEKNSEIRVTSMFYESLGVVGAAIMFTPQLWKLNATRLTAATWSCINNPPDAYLANRNERRYTIPQRYLDEVFGSNSHHAEQFRMACMGKMLLTKR